MPDLPDDAPWIRIAADNQGLLMQIAAELATTTVFAGAGLSPEHNVAHEIIEINRRLPIPLKWERVKGHQDAVRKWCELTRVETLNVRAGTAPQQHSKQTLLRPNKSA